MRISRIVDRYVLTEVTGPFVGATVFICFIFLMFQALRLAEFFIVHGVPALLLLNMSALMMLSVLPIALPLAFLVGVLIGFGRLSADSELVAMKANGIGLPRLSVPVLLLALVITALSIGLNMEWVPAGDLAFKRLLVRIGNTKVVSSIKEGAFTSNFFDMLVFADKVDAKTNRMKHVFIYDESHPNTPMAVVAQSGEVIPVKQAGSLSSAVILRLKNGNIHTNDVGTTHYQKIDFNEYQVFKQIDEGTDASAVKPRMLDYRTLFHLIQVNKTGSDWHREYTMELWRRIAVALMPIIFVFLGAGFGTVRTRAMRAGAGLVGIAAAGVFWGLQACGTVLIHRHCMAPVPAMLMPDIALAIVALYGYRSAMW